MFWGIMSSLMVCLRDFDHAPRLSWCVFHRELGGCNRPNVGLPPLDHVQRSLLSVGVAADLVSCTVWWAVVEDGRVAGHDGVDRSIIDHGAYHGESQAPTIA